MAKILHRFLVCLMGLHTLQVAGQMAFNRTNSTDVDLKNFIGRTVKRNRNLQYQPPPQLDVDRNGPATEYIRGVISSTVIPLCYGLAMVVGIPSNVYILHLLRVKPCALSTAVLYISLASSDLLVLLSLSLRLHYHLNGNVWVFGEAACRAVTAVFYGNMYYTAHAIACLSLTRYVAVSRPFVYKGLPKTALALGVCIGLWLMFGAAVLPELIVRQTYQVTENITTCHDILPLEEPSHAPLVPYRLALICVGFMIPFVVRACAHAGLVYHLGQSGSNWWPFVKVCTLVLVIFVVCFSPSGVLHFAHYVCLLSHEDDSLYGYFNLAVCLCCFHSCLDPFLCLLMSKMVTSVKGTPQTTAVVRREPGLAGLGSNGLP